MNHILVISPNLGLRGGTEKQVSVVYKRISKNFACDIIQSRWSNIVFGCTHLHIWRSDAIFVLIVGRILGKKCTFMIRDSTPYRHQKTRWLLIRLCVLLASEVLSNSFAGLENYNALRIGRVVIND